ncbi:amiloride-sensitive sodium channel domain-containing protein [Ditylenchus destructor]|uniref:Amiloride-sensitive sodium channel domain-containing protein n=1 Tax=Ditylenchus destructor TaxID=166010 RepID=A0AAD4QTK7_9BILA|nr:amiloride-sensitive sodium channel domain-containing protein [Ditylenchus destructor]
MFVEDDKSPRPKSILKRKLRDDVERPQQTHKSKWDQFCDFSSLVGFRLLHSKHSPKLRFVSAMVMLVSAALISYQTQAAVKRLVQSDNRRIGYVTQNDIDAIDQPEFLVCVTNQAFTIERAYGNVDFRLLVANYLSDVKSSKNFDYFLVRVNAFEMVKSAKVAVHFLHKGIRANVVELVPGKSLEVTIRGASEIMSEGCKNAYPEGCVAPGTNYTQYNCKWCVPETRKACSCNNPESYLENYIEKYNRNCSFLEVAKCSPAQKLSYSQERSACRNPCQTFAYSLGYALQELTVEMLEMSAGDEDRIAEEYQTTMDRMMDFQFHRYSYQSLDDIKFEDAIWKTRADLDRNFLSKYYTMVVHFYKVVYGSDFIFPAIFLEDLADPLKYQPNVSIKSVMDLATLSPGAIDTCGNPDLQAALVQYSTGFFEYFRNTSFHKWYPCPISLSADSCANFLSFTWNATVLEKLKKNIMSVSGSRQSTLELAITLNASAVNPFAIVQFYSKVENFAQFKQMKSSLSAETETLLRLMNGLSRPLNECMRAKLRNLETVWESDILNATYNWADEFQHFLKRNKGLYLMDGYLKANFALLTIYYQGLTHQKVIYRDDYSFWDFMTELGGNLGLYFGLTIITVYEMLVFLMIDKEPPEARVPIEHKFTKRILYSYDPAILQTDQPIPTIF